ncbi:MAG: hypothetical protein AB7I04_14970 [Pseudomonadales bacterium]
MKSPVVVVLCLFLGAPASALELDVRGKLFGVGTALPEESLQRQVSGTPAYDYTVDLRLMFKQDAGRFSFGAHYDLIANGGDSYAYLTNPGVTLDQSATSDRFRLMDLTWNVDSGDRHQIVQRLDRLALQYRGATWGFVLGREAVSWGSGIVFQPMDLISPFAPTTVDTDFKNGDDMLVVDKLFADGSDLQFLAVARRDLENDVTTDVASGALKWRKFLGGVEFELFGARHYEDQVYGGSLRIPIGGALLRSDLVATKLDAGGEWYVSGVLNADVSFDLGGRTTYVFAEYYHNDFGVSSLPESVLLLPEPLTERLARGEVFTLMRDYLAAGGSIQWHPLWTQSLTVIGNLNDGSGLVQSAVSYVPSDQATLEGGFTWSIGDPGEEYGGIPLLGDGATTGGAFQTYLRWVYYF